jgi:hypothetical protein
VLRLLSTSVTDVSQVPNALGPKSTLIEHEAVTAKLEQAGQFR